MDIQNTNNGLLNIVADQNEVNVMSGLVDSIIEAFANKYTEGIISPDQKTFIDTCKCISDALKPFVV